MVQVYTDEDIPLDLAVKQAGLEGEQQPGLTTVIVETFDRVRIRILHNVLFPNCVQVSLTGPHQSGLHQLAAAAELKQQAEEEEMDTG